MTNPAKKKFAFTLNIRLLGIIFRYAISIIAAFVSLWARYFIQGAIGGHLPEFITFYPIVIFIALFAGLGPGLTATASSAFLAWLFVYQPVREPGLSHQVEQVSIALFVIMGFSISVIAQLYRRGRQKIASYEYERAEAAQVERQRLYDVLETLPVYVVLLDKDYRVPFANKFFRERFGESRGKRCYEYLFNRGEACENCETYKVMKTRARHHWEWTGPDNRNYDIYDFPFRDIDGSAMILEMGIDVTERKLAEAELEKHRHGLEELIEERTKDLKESEDRLQRAQEIAHLGSWELNLANGKLAWSDEVYRIFGFRPQEFGATYEAFLERVHPDDRAAVDSAYTESLREGKDSYEIEHRVVRSSDGEIRVVHEKCSHVRDASGRVMRSIGMVHDVTERRRAEDALRKSEERVRLKLKGVLSPEGSIEELEFSDIIDSEEIQALMDDFHKLVNIPMAIIDLNGNTLVGVGWQKICTGFHRVNPETCKFCVESDTRLTMGVKPGEFKVYKCKNNLWDVATPLMIGGKQFGNLFMGQFFFKDEAIDYGIFRAQAKRYGFNEEEYIAALDGVPRLTKESVSLGMAFLMKVAQMISNLSYSNIKLARSLSERDMLTNSLRESEKELKRSNESLEQFAYVASHDLQEPLRVMSNYSQLLEKRYKDKLDPDANDFIDFIVDAAGRMQRLITDLLSYSRVGRKDLSIADVDFNEVLHGVLYSISLTIESLGGAVTHDALPVLRAHETSITQLFQNLIGNALKFRGEAAPVIHVGAKKNKDEWIFSVKDNGLGIEAQYHEKIFHIFQRLHSKEKYSGTGIGLSICKKIVSNYGGRIWVESRLGEGSTFYFTMPALTERETK